MEHNYFPFVPYSGDRRIEIAICACCPRIYGCVTTRKTIRLLKANLGGIPVGWSVRFWNAELRKSRESATKIQNHGWTQIHKDESVAIGTNDG